MKGYKIPVEWSVYATVEVKGNSLDDAVKRAKDNVDELPAVLSESEYVDGSYRINDDDKELIQSLNK